MTDTIPMEPVQAPIYQPRKNAWGNVALVFAIFGLLLTISILGIPLGIILLVIAFILGFIGIWFKPRGKAVTSLLISILILGGMGYFVVSTAKVVVEPVKEFVTWIIDESKNNPEMKEAFSQDGFSVFFESRINQRFKDIDWKGVSQDGDWKDILGFYTRFGLDQVKEELLLSVNLWIAEYGYLTEIDEDILPLDEETLDEIIVEEDSEDGVILSEEEIEVLIEEDPDQTVHEEIEMVLEVLE